MKTLMLFLVLIFTFQLAHCQETEPLTVQSNQEMYDFYISKQKKLKTTGWILLGTGAAAMGVGAAIGLNEIFSEDRTGETLFFAGVLTTISSIPVFIISGSNKRKAKAILASGEVGIGAIPFNNTRYASIGLKVDFWHISSTNIMKNSIVFLLILLFINNLVSSQNIVTISELERVTVDGQVFLLFNGSKFNGYLLRNHEHNHDKMLMEIKEGIPEGLFENYYESGKLKSRAHLKDGKGNGLFSEYYENGQLKKRVNTKDGKIIGPVEYFHENGQLKSKVNTKDGKSDGLYEEYFETGQLKLQENYKNGLGDGPIFEYYKSGQIRWKGFYKKNKKDGLFLEYYENGELKGEVTYKNGELKEDVNYKKGEEVK